jgi:hypothetical protein
LLSPSQLRLLAIESIKAILKRRGFEDANGSVCKWSAEMKMNRVERQIGRSWRGFREESGSERALAIDAARKIEHKRGGVYPFLSVSGLFLVSATVVVMLKRQRF